MKKKQIVLIGAGAVGSHLAKALFRAGHSIDLIISRSHSSGELLAREVGASFSIRLEDLPSGTSHLFLTLPDQALEPVLSRLPKSKAIVVHTSGSQDLKLLQGYGTGFGVFYPLQSFSRAVEQDWSAVPVFIEGSDETVERELIQLAKDLGAPSRIMNSEQRRMLHLAAVFTSNFTNFLQGIAQQILLDQEIPPSLLQPLALKTIAKSYEIGAYDAQTGPARRGDKLTIKKHLELLSCRPKDQEIYRSLSEKILDLYFPKK